MVKGMQTVLRNAKDLDAETAAQYITEYCNMVQTQAYDDAGDLLNNVKWYMSHNSNTMKNGRNPETHEVIDELKEIDPMVVNLDASAYGNIPEPAQEKGGSNLMGSAVVLAVLIAALVIVFRTKKKS